MAKPELRLKARVLREQGDSVKEIAQCLNVSQSTVSRWVRDISLSAEQEDALKERQRHWANQNSGAKANAVNYLQSRQTYQEQGRQKAKERKPLHHAGCMLYWAEGAKDRNRVDFVNSDPDMMILFVRFLREELLVSDAEITARVHCHTSDAEQIKQIEAYWSSLLSIPLDQFGKTQIKTGTNSRKNRLPNGICGVRVEKTEIVQHIYGAIQEYGGFDRPDWLF